MKTLTSELVLYAIRAVLADRAAFLCEYKEEKEKC